MYDEPATAPLAKGLQEVIGAILGRRLSSNDLIEDTMKEAAERIRARFPEGM